jgi:hypothetical protein
MIKNLRNAREESHSLERIASIVMRGKAFVDDDDEED